MLEQYNIEGTIDINQNRKDHAYKNPDTWKNYQEDFTCFKQYLIDSFEKHIPLVLIRVYDGEFLFLQGKKLWNVGKRHISKTITKDLQNRFMEGSLRCDKFSSHLTVCEGGNMNKLYKSVYGSKKIDYPMEFNYAIVLNKWVFKTFKNKIGLIGGCEKIKVIQELMKHQEYKDYLGIDEFLDYISVPERFACDHVDKLEEEIGEKLNKSKSRIFLFGIGISKLAVAHTFKKYHNAIYIDIGTAFTALAGTTTKNRPYSAGWINYKLRNYDYSKMDPMDHGKDENIKYLP